MNSLETTVIDRQRTISVDRRSLRGFLDRLTRRLPPDRATAWTVCLVSDRKMRQLNREFRELNRATDVLSFPDEGVSEPDGTVYLGDVVISAQTADLQARDAQRPLQRELESLALHGYLHLLGYDHETDDGRMLRLQRELECELIESESAL